MGRNRALILSCAALAVALVAGLYIGTVQRKRQTPPAVATTEAVRSLPGHGGELVAAIPTDPAGFNRYAGVQRIDNIVELLALLLQDKLVRVNRMTGVLEPRLAESWTRSDDALTYTLKLRQGVKFSDGAPFSSADVTFAFEAIRDPASASPLAEAMTVRGKPIVVTATDPATIVITFPEPFGPGLRILDNLPILPRHKLEAALRAGTLKDAWTLATPASDIVGAGPFRLTTYEPGIRFLLERNPYFWRKDANGAQLPYLDRLTLTIVRDQNTEALRMEQGQIDVGAREIRPEDYGSFRQLQAQGRVVLADAGISLDPNMLWFNLAPNAYAGDPRKQWLQSEDFRKAISSAVDRQVLVDTVFLGEGVPIFGPVTPGARDWYTDDVPRYPYDPARTRSLLRESLGFTDNDKDGMLEDRTGQPVRFSILTQQGETIRMRSSSVIQEQLRRAGIAVDIVALDPPAIFERFGRGQYDAIYYGVEATSTDPANNQDFWLSSGGFHVWNPGQKTPATPWEKHLDDLAHQQAAATDPATRRRLYMEMQQVFGEHVPILYFAAPKLIVALSPKVTNAQPVPVRPLVLWNAETLGVNR
ncbi:MAG: ABC transporter substrate-binding protein [Acidobacteriota bacterium]